MMIELKNVTHLSSNEKGSTFELPAIENSGMLLASRKAGTQFGNHWHEGKVPGKNPEKLLLLSGTVKVYVKHLDSGEEQALLVEAPRLIFIFPRTLHRFEALEDCSFLEFNALAEHQADTYYPEQ